MNRIDSDVRAACSIAFFAVFATACTVDGLSAVDSGTDDSATPPKDAIAGDALPEAGADATQPSFDATTDATGDAGPASPICGDGVFGPAGVLDDGGMMGFVSALSGDAGNNGVLGVSSDGKVLHERYGAMLLLSVPADGGYDTVDLEASALGVTAYYGAISSDGTQLVLESSTFDRLFAAPLEGTTVGVLDPTPFATVNSAVAPGGQILSPVLSDNGLSLYYKLSKPNPGGGTEDLGTFVSTRSDTSASFGAGAPLQGTLQYAANISAVSADDLTLFAWSGYPPQVSIFSRSVAADPWPNTAGMVVRSDGGYYASAAPTAGCQAILAMCGPSSTGAPPTWICQVARQ